ncbi:hypothetical protein QIT55_gp41 [Nitrosopumilus spindle-shaped virus]|uniref:Uncharacterized protein n=1 Tax=Nitrosopumilus spindle-shaped virus 1 TaxID=2848002 RepID=A0A514K319_9VIRU|nr:hypothetical protein QIT55_gp41 [Nitrosopumilus spindle-shaped virus]QDI74027.1 hypothetical protein [Nitrosopumilus spindle-shaped virus]
MYTQVLVLFGKKDTKNNGIARKISDKLTLFKLKRKNLNGEKCTKCGWRKIKSDFSNMCSKCTKENKPGI